MAIGSAGAAAQTFSFKDLVLSCHQVSDVLYNVKMAINQTRRLSYIKTIPNSTMFTHAPQQDIVNVLSRRCECSIKGLILLID
ncbi:hypothetical protein J5N97_028161 [Dioscorea zingiberensis]|uniref:Uncharacterized protein n=1 Tax=Dioscorea zingiberensis TaxID=325984 RepID=A0A9D5BYL3_9LILI|nr:hypothetical protein J5N97_028161 [Dioscorea zingiberensis]